MDMLRGVMDLSAFYPPPESLCVDPPAEAAPLFSDVIPAPCVERSFDVSVDRLVHENDTVGPYAEQSADDPVDKLTHENDAVDQCAEQSVDGPVDKLTHENDAVDQCAEQSVDDPVDKLAHENHAVGPCAEQSVEDAVEKLACENDAVGVCFSPLTLPPPGSPLAVDRAGPAPSPPFYPASQGSSDGRPEIDAGALSRSFPASEALCSPVPAFSLSFQAPSSAEAPGEPVTAFSLSAPAALSAEAPAQETHPSENAATHVDRGAGSPRGHTVPHDYGLGSWSDHRMSDESGNNSDEDAPHDVDMGYISGSQRVRTMDEELSAALISVRESVADGRNGARTPPCSELNPQTLESLGYVDPSRSGLRLCQSECSVASGLPFYTDLYNDSEFLSSRKQRAEAGAVSGEATLPLGGDSMIAASAPHEGLCFPVLPATLPLGGDSVIASSTPHEGLCFPLLPVLAVLDMRAEWEVARIGGGVQRCGGVQAEACANVCFQLNSKPMETRRAPATAEAGDMQKGYDTPVEGGSGQVDAEPQMKRRVRRKNKGENLGVGGIMKVFADHGVQGRKGLNAERRMEMCQPSFQSSSVVDLTDGGKAAVLPVEPIFQLNSVVNMTDGGKAAALPVEHTHFVTSDCADPDGIIHALCNLSKAMTTPDSKIGQSNASSSRPRKRRRHVNLEGVGEYERAKNYRLEENEVVMKSLGIPSDEIVKRRPQPVCKPWEALPAFAHPPWSDVCVMGYFSGQSAGWVYHRKDHSYYVKSFRAIKTKAGKSKRFQKYYAKNGLFGRFDLIYSGPDVLIGDSVPKTQSARKIVLGTKVTPITDCVLFRNVGTEDDIKSFLFIPDGAESSFNKYIGNMRYIQGRGEELFGFGGYVKFFAEVDFLYLSTRSDGIVAHYSLYEGCNTYERGYYYHDIWDNSRTFAYVALAVNPRVENCRSDSSEDPSE